jgi:hypothetical protein
MMEGFLAGEGKESKSKKLAGEPNCFLGGGHARFMNCCRIPGMETSSSFLFTRPTNKACSGNPRLPH